MSSNTLIGGDTLVTVPKGTVAALTKLDVNVSGFGSANLSFDAAGDLLADFPITGGYADAYDVILHQGSGLTFSDSHGSITVSDFRVDTHTDVVYGDVALKTGSTSVSENNVDIFNIGAGLSLTFTSDAIGAVNEALGSSLTTAVPVGTAAPHQVANPLPTSFEELSLVRDFFHDYGFQGQTQPIVGGHTDVTLTSAATLTSLGIHVSTLGSATVDASGASPVAEFPITGGTEQSAGDVILHEGSGLALSTAHDTVDLQNADGAEARDPEAPRHEHRLPAHADGHAKCARRHAPGGDRQASRHQGQPLRRQGGAGEISGPARLRRGPVDRDRRRDEGIGERADEDRLAVHRR